MVVSNYNSVTNERIPLRQADEVHVGIFKNNRLVEINVKKF